MLNGTNFKDWKRHLHITLGCMDLDLALREEQPAPLTAKSTQSFRGSESDEIIKATDFLDEIEKCLRKTIRL
ncbi:hypothetical protein LINPERHAP1_LOCUS30107 [Linum perenne]